MCGIFGAFSNQTITKNNINQLALHAEQRGVDSSGLCFIEKSTNWLYTPNSAVWIPVGCVLLKNRNLKL